MKGNFLVYAKGDVPENDMVIECSDINDMNHYAKECRKQRYKKVRTKFKSKAGLVVYEATADDTRELGGNGICDFCGNPADKGFLIAVLSSYYCQKCYDRWDIDARAFPGDEPVEHRREMYFDSVFDLK